MVEEVARFRKDILKDFIIKSNLLSFLTDNSNFNSEIFKRSIPIFEFAQKHDLLTVNILNRILNLSKDKHELELKSFYSALCEFGKFLGKSEVTDFFDEITKLPLDEYLILLIKDFTISAIDYHPYYRKKYQ